MKERLLFEGELSDVSLENVFQTLISVIKGSDPVIRTNYEEI